MISTRLHGITLQQTVLIMKYSDRQGLVGQSVTIENYSFYCSILSLDLVSLVFCLWLRQVTMKRETEIALDMLMTNH
jgi:hypothetical protein